MQRGFVGVETIPVKPFFYRLWTEKERRCVRLKSARGRADRAILVHRNLRRLPEGVHSKDVRQAAIVLFEVGLGYKRTTRRLKLKESTVRD